MDSSHPEVVNHGGVDFKEKLAELKKAGVKIHPLVWDIMYLYLADYLSVINLLCGYYLKRNEAVSIDDGKQIQAYNRKASHIVDVILFPEKIQESEHELQKIKDEARKLPPGLKSFLSHYVNNALHSMSFVIDDSIDPKFLTPISIRSTTLIYNSSSQIINVLEGIRKELQGIDRVQV